MRVVKTVHGEKIPYTVKLILNTMTAQVMYWREDEPTIGIITEDFKYILLPDTFLSTWISGYGKVPIKKLKLNKIQQIEAREYNGNFKRTR